MKNFISILLLTALFCADAQAQCWKNVAAGYYHTLAIKTDGTLWAWGGNSYGQLGNGTKINTSTPDQIGNGTNWKSVAANEEHTLAIKTDGTLWAWGFNPGGQLGDGTNVDKSSPVQIGNDTNWQSIGAGAFHTHGIKTDGTLWGWGNNSYGQLGDGTKVGTNNPTQIGNDTNWQSVTAGYYHALAIKTDGTLWAWGSNYAGQLGDGTNIEKSGPVQIGNDSNWKSVTVGQSHTLAIKTDGTLWAWGRNGFGQLGDGTNIDKNSPVQIGNGTNWKSVDARAFHTHAIKTDGTLWAWGNNNSENLGDGTDVNKNNPVQIGNTANWQRVGAGEFNTLAIKTDGTLWTWGNNLYGQLGDGTNANKNTPTALACPTSFLPGNTCFNAYDIQGLFGGVQGVAQTSDLYDNTLYTSASDPTAGIGCFYQNDQLARTIWYTFTGDGNKYSIRTVKCNATNYITDGNTQLVIYRGFCGGLDPVLCAEDEDRANNVLNAYAVIFTVAGTKYSMLIDGWADRKGEYCVEVTNLTPAVSATETGRSEIRLFPNPTTGLVRLENIEAERVEAFDQLGRLERRFEQPGGSVDLSGAAAGVFFLKIFEKGKTHWARVVKE